MGRVSWSPQCANETRKAYLLSAVRDASDVGRDLAQAGAVSLKALVWKGMSCLSFNGAVRTGVDAPIWLRNSVTPLLRSASLRSNSCTTRFVSVVSPMVRGMDMGAEVGKT